LLLGLYQLASSGLSFSDILLLISGSNFYGQFINRLYIIIIIYVLGSFHLTNVCML
jgi:hypothetical protein